MKRHNLIAYASSFTSFLLDTFTGRIDRILLFGSVARGDFDTESDIDVFVDTPEHKEQEINRILSLFKESEVHRKWELKGLTSELSLKVGRLAEWKLRRSVISDGVLLYGKFKDIPEKVEHYLLLSLSFAHIPKSKQVKLWRKLYGYKQKVGKKIYTTEGLLSKLDGKRLEGVSIVPVKNSREIMAFLKEHKVTYTLNEMFSDTL